MTRVTPGPKPSRDEIALEYIDRLAYAPYPVQEEALYAWAACQDGVLLSAPTGTGKTLVAEAAVFEGLRTGQSVYYSTPLIALTDQKFAELQDTVERWGYSRDQVGLVTGQRTVNPHALIKVVVAEVLLNRLLHPEVFDFAEVGTVVMDEFHNFNEPQRGIVWELALSLLPKHVRVMLLSATVGAAHEFINWMARSIGRNVTLVEGKDRRVPLHFQWVGDELLPDFLERVALGADTQRRTPLLLFCFDRSICWDVAEVLRGKDLLVAGQRDALLARLESFDFSVGVGNKLRTFLTRGVGIHHAGVLPRYRRVVETLFQEKLLPVCICTETLAAGINLPARSVVLTTLVKGPKLKKKLIEPSSAQQIFGRAGRPQFDTEGHVFALAHEDDVKIARWEQKYDSIPEENKDPKMMAAKKALLKKKPTRRQNVVYWNSEQFTKLQTAPPSKLASRGRLSWRWLGFLLEADPNVEPIRDVIRRRLMDAAGVDVEQKRLTRMLVTLQQVGVVTLNPPPPAAWQRAVTPSALSAAPVADPDSISNPPGDDEEEVPSSRADLLGRLKLGGGGDATPAGKPAPKPASPTLEAYEPLTATPTDKLRQLMSFRAVHPMYGLYLLDHLARANDAELIQILESLLEMPGSVAKLLRVPRPGVLPSGPLTTDFVDPAILTRGLASHDDMYPADDQSDLPPELRKYPIPLAEKMKMLFESEVDHAGGLTVNPVWAVGDLLAHGGGFDAFVRSRDLLKQEGVLFKHLLRMVLLCQEMKQLNPTPYTPPTPESPTSNPSSEALNSPHTAHSAPAATPPPTWSERLSTIADNLTEICRKIDPQSTDELLVEAADP
jgi:hypothetical protein